MTEIEKLRSRVDELEAQYRAAREVLYAAMADASPTKVGDILVSSKLGQRMEVSALRCEYDRVVVYGRKFLKSGKLHARESRVYGSDGWIKDIDAPMPSAVNK